MFSPANISEGSSAELTSRPARLVSSLARLISFKDGHLSHWFPPFQNKSLCGEEIKLETLGAITGMI